MPTLLQTAPMSELESSRSPLVFAYYVTGHGFGHATRVVEVRSLTLARDQNESLYSCN